MPKTIHGHPVDEAKWAEAKNLAAEQGHEEDYAYIMGIYKRMAGLEKALNRAGLVRTSVTATVDGKPYQTHRWKRPAQSDDLSLPKKTMPSIKNAHSGLPDSFPKRGENIYFHVGTAGGVRDKIRQYGMAYLDDGTLGYAPDEGDDDGSDPKSWRLKIKDSAKQFYVTEESISDIADEIFSAYHDNQLYLEQRDVVDMYLRNADDDEDKAKENFINAHSPSEIGNVTTYDNPDSVNIVAEFAGWPDTLVFENGALLLNEEAIEAEESEAQYAMRKKKNKTSLTKAMEGFHADIERATKKNKNYRRVLYTGPHAQLVLMSLKAGENVGEEVHEHLDQFIRIDAGEGLAIIGKRKYPLKDGDAIVIPAGAKHNIIARSTLKLYAVYTSTEHPDGLVERTKQEDGMKKSIRLVVPFLLKARKSPKLVPIKRTVYRDGTSYTATYWVLPGQAKQGDVSGAQADLFDQIPSGAQMDLFDQAPQAEMTGPDEEETAEKAPVEEAPKPKDDKVYKDVGEKIGGAKKDLWVQIKDGKRSLSLSDMDDMDDGTARTIVKKSHIIPENYIESLKESGVEPAAAFMIWKTLSFISPEPATDTRQARINYVAAIERIMKGLRDVKTLDDFRQSFTQLQRESTGILLNAYEKAEYDEYQEASMKFREARKEVWKRLYSEELGKLKEISISGSDRANTKASSRLYEWDRENRKKYIDDSLKTPSEIERASEKRQEKDPESLLNIIGSLGERMVDMLKGRSKAFNDQYGMVGYNVKDWSWMDSKKGGEKKKGQGRQKPVWERDVDEQVERSGGETKTYTPEMLMDEFGFRGVEYGNWMDEASSAHHTQMLGLSFQDMAKVLDIPVEQVSFNRRLAIAFGARGGGNALAHYEPNRKVINLTKFKGGGSLAHEWFHFLDNVTRMAATGGNVQFSFMTEIGEKDKESREGVDPQVVFAWNELKKSLMEGNTRPKKSDPEKNIYRRFNFVDNLLARMKPQEVIDYIYQNHPGHATDKWMASCANYIHFKTETQVSYGKGQSGLLATAQAMGAYWQKPIEMAARAFEGYVHDKMRDVGMRNTYLTKDRCSNEYCTAWAKAYNVPSSPYPIGEERKTINAAFDRLMEALRKDNTLQKAMRIAVWTLE